MAKIGPSPHGALPESSRTPGAGARVPGRPDNTLRSPRRAPTQRVPADKAVDPWVEMAQLVLPGGARNRLVTEHQVARDQLAALGSGHEPATRSSRARGSAATVDPQRWHNSAQRAGSPQQQRASEADAALRAAAVRALSGRRSAGLWERVHQQAARQGPLVAAAVQRALGTVAEGQLATYRAASSEAAKQAIFEDRNARFLLHRAVPGSECSLAALKRGNICGFDHDHPLIRRRLFEMVADGHAERWTGASAQPKTADGRAWQVRYLKSRSGDLRMFTIGSEATAGRPAQQHLLWVGAGSSLPHQTRGYEQIVAQAVKTFCADYPSLRQDR